MSPRRTRAKDLRRKTGTRPVRKTIVIFCEGEASEPDYINGLKNLPQVRRRTSVQIEIDPGHGVPLTLVRRAVERATDPEVDECWCVFDVEWPKHHPNLAQAIDLATTHGIKLAVSNPCFELWLILHTRDQYGHLDTKTCESRSRAIDNRTGKRLDPNFYLKLRAQAIRRARKLTERHRGDRTAFPHDNPSTGFHELVMAIDPTALETGTDR